MWQKEELYFEAAKYYEAAISEINKAQHTILLESYIFDYDDVGKKFLTALAQAAKRKVHIKLMVDGIGSFQSSEQLRKFCESSNIQYSVYHPVKLKIGFFKFINKRNHRKVIIIDNTKAFVGSFNITQASLNWHDTGVYVEGDSVHDLSKAFLSAWLKTEKNIVKRFRGEWKNTVEKLNKKFIRLNFKFDWRRFFSTEFNQKLKQAQKRILITNAYFLPRRTEMKSLKEAALRGVYVGLCLPKESDVWIIKIVSRLFYPQLLNYGIHIYEYIPNILHSKTVVIDDWASVGSHNFNHRSFIHDLEVQAVITHPENVNRLAEKWEQDISKSIKIKVEDLNKAGLFEKVFSRFAYWFRYWM